MCREVVAHLNTAQARSRSDAAADPPLYDSDDLLGIVSKDLRQPFDMREVMPASSMARIRGFQAAVRPTLVTGWASIHGYPLGILGNNGALMSESSEGTAQFIMQPDRRAALFLHNITGYRRHRFRAARITKDGSKMINAVSNSTVPHLTVIVGASRRSNWHERPPSALALRPTANRGDGSKQMAGVMPSCSAAPSAGDIHERPSKRARACRVLAEERSKPFATSRVSTMP